jgi:hypothetical protein
MTVRVVIPNVASRKLGIANSTAIHEKYSSLTVSGCTVLFLGLVVQENQRKGLIFPCPATGMRLNADGGDPWAALVAHFSFATFRDSSHARWHFKCCTRDLQPPLGIKAGREASSPRASCRASLGREYGHAEMEEQFLDTEEHSTKNGTGICGESRLDSEGKSAVGRSPPTYQ